MHILGIDPSTKTGIVFIPEKGSPIPKLITFKEARGFERVLKLKESFSSLLDQYPTKLAVIDRIKRKYRPCFAFIPKNSFLGFLH